MNEEISAAIDQAFPRTVWIRGEVQRLPVDAARRQHVYFELHETGGSGAAEYQVSVSLMGWDRDRFALGRYLDGTDPDFQLANKLEVCLECKVDFYAKFGKLSLKIVGVDRTFSLGKLEARRREILAYLAAGDLLDRNASVPLSDLPLRIGLITSPGSAAERDFQTGLETSPWKFRVVLRGAKMQGEQLEGQIIAALEALSAQNVDVIVITRGGGSRADLSWFDQKDLAEGIARCPVPVVTAIGHEIDRSIADLVAHHACKTPTAAAEFLVGKVEEAAVRLEDAAEALGARAAELLLEAHRRVDLGGRLQRASEARLLRSRLLAQNAAGRGLTVGRERLAGAQVALAAAGRASLAHARDRTAGQARRLVREAPRSIVVGHKRLEGLAVQARLLDPAALLARGFTMTVAADGRLLKGAGEIAPGERITTRFKDGEIDSIVQPGGRSVPGRRSQAVKGKPSGGKKKNPGQKTLFR